MRIEFVIAAVLPPLFAATLAYGQGREKPSTDPQAGSNDVISERDFAECPIAAINAAYRDAAKRDTNETFSLLAIEQDTLRQCIERADLIAKLIETNNKVQQQVGIAVGASDNQPTAVFSTQNCPAAPESDTQSANSDPERQSTDQVPAAAGGQSPVKETPAPTPALVPAQSCARGYEVVYTAGANNRLSALIQRRDEQWHVTRGFKLPGNVTVKDIKRNGAVIISEQGEDHVLPAAATTNANDDAQK